MAQRRMTSLEVIDTDAFLDMPMSSQLLYFHLNARADDDGFVANPKKILRTLGGSSDDYKVLVAKKFLIEFEDGVCVIKHWRINNFIRKDIYKETKYLDLKRSLFIRSNGAYTLNDDGQAIPVPNGHYKLEDVDSTLTQRQLRIGKDREDTGGLEDEPQVVKILSPEEEERPKRQLKVTKEMQAVFDVFEDNPARKVWKLHEVQREAAAVLFQEYGVDEVLKRYTVARAYRGSEMCPLISTPLDLLNKMPNMENFLKSLQT